MVTVILPRNLNNKNQNAMAIQNALLGQANTNLKKLRNQNPEEKLKIREAKDGVYDESTGVPVEQTKIIIHEDVKKKDGTTVMAKDLLDDWSFGNGITSLSGMPLKNGEKIPVIIIVFEPTVETSVNEELTTMANIINNL